MCPKMVVALALVMSVAYPRCGTAAEDMPVSLQNTFYPNVEFATSENKMCTFQILDEDGEGNFQMLKDGWNIVRVLRVGKQSARLQVVKNSHPADKAPRRGTEWCDEGDTVTVDIGTFKEMRAEAKLIAAENRRVRQEHRPTSENQEKLPPSHP